MSGIDAKQKVLISIYLEYQKDIPDMTLIKHFDLGLDYDVFKVAVSKLLDEGLITDAIISFGGQGLIPIHVNLINCRMTRYGIDYVEEKLEIEKNLSGEMKVKKAIEKVGSGVGINSKILEQGCSLKLLANIQSEKDLIRCKSFSFTGEALFYCKGLMIWQ